jgi:IS4 transposase
MSHQDLHARNSHPEGLRCNSVYLHQALQWLLAGVDFSGTRFRKDCSWTPRWLVSAAFLWAWSNESTQGERFFCAQRLVRELQGGQAKAATSIQAFMKLLLRWTKQLIDALTLAFRLRMERDFRQHWRRFGYVVFGMDGSRIQLPRTKSNEQHYSKTKAKKKKRCRRKKPNDRAADRKAQLPQMWLTTLFHVGLHLPWNWRIGPSDSSERAHALEMLDALPVGSLLCGDAGFVGYEFLKTIRDKKCELLVRVGANVALLKSLGYVRESAGTVYVWPDKAARQSQLPLVFRHVVIQGPRYPIHLIVSVTNPRRLSDAQVAQLYRARWGIEVFYRHLKQTFGRRKLLSHRADHAQVELEWSLIALWGMGLYASAELDRRKIPLERMSMAGVLRAFRRIARDYLHPADRQQTLCTQIRTALMDQYQRHDKTSRDYPRRKQEHPAGPPAIHQATAKEKKRLQQLTSKRQQTK